MAANARSEQEDMAVRLAALEARLAAIADAGAAAKPESGTAAGEPP